MSFICFKCKRTFVHQYEHILHRNSHKSEFCDEETRNLGYMECYVYEYDGINCHYKHLTYRCGNCDKEYLYENRCRSHLKTHDLKNECILCDKTFNCTRHLKEHLQLHTHETPYRCGACNKPFLRKDKLFTHTKTHTKEGKENVGLDNHLQSRKRFFKCNLCPKQYARKQNLSLHLRSHSDDLPYGCEYCGQQFLRSDHLKYHEGIHKYDVITNTCSCTVCGKWFLKELLKPHVTEQHWGNMQFKCEICDKAFKRKGNLIYHKRSHIREGLIV